ncbi:ribosome biogenesis GTPase YqeH [Sharpea azabuensis]|uniref:CP-type G domain-containing protein n=1 Tax=Sharpea azabuensis TaxID=322505 RepID=A0A1H6QFT7_9FIRM|nr:ribosome biogenesis GTPase YqeH [Sharpea azabuensis]SEI37832.1 hypothetical protein SAMN04487834_100192 [Sharpea azabuensis]
MEEKRCYGCGAVIQSTDPKKIGYVPQSANQGEHVLCQRCFKLQHYHQQFDASLSAEDFLKMISVIGDKNCLVVYIVDIFDYDGSAIPGLMRHIGYNDVLLLANKRDILPKSLKDHHIEMWLRRRLKEEGIKPLDVILTSCKKNYHFDEIYDAIDNYRKGRDVFVVGMSNVGKSTFINGLLKHYGQSDGFITTSEFPGTTLDLIKIPLDEKSAIYDTPGIINKHQYTQVVDAKTLKLIMPQGEVKPMTYQLNGDQTLFIGGLARFDYLGDTKASITTFFSKRLKIHRTKTSKATSLYDNHKELSPCLDRIARMQDMVMREYFLKDGQEVVISGLGFITVKPANKVRIYVPKDIDVFVRDALI